MRDYLGGETPVFTTLDPSTGRLPAFSPYMFVNNDPIRYVDPDGSFLLDVHQRIATNAYFALYRVGYGVPNYRSSIDGGSIKFKYPSDISHQDFHNGDKNGVYIENKSQNFAEGIFGNGTIWGGGITDPDWNEQHIKASHFDQMDYTHIIANFQSIKTQTTEFITKYKNGELTEYGLGYQVGKKLHGIEDFYSHSNYIELYVQTYGKVEDVNSIPTIDDALGNKQFEKFAAIIKTSLKTGEYPGKGPDSHREMNHDVGAGSNYTYIVPETRGKKVTYQSRAAEAVATKASLQYLQQVKKEVENK